MTPCESLAVGAVRTGSLRLVGSVVFLLDPAVSLVGAVAVLVVHVVLAMWGTHLLFGLQVEEDDTRTRR